MAITFAMATTKGGSGKSTLSAVLAGAFAHQDLSVLIVDTDPQLTLVKWAGRCAAKGRTEPRVTVQAALTEQELIAALSRGDFDVTIVDVKGEGNSTTLPIVVANCDLVVIPCVASDFDAAEIFNIPNLLKAVAGKGRTPTPYVVVLNSVDGIEVASFEFRSVVGRLYQSGLNIASSVVSKRTKYREVAGGYGSLYQMKKRDPGLVKAIANIEDLAEDLMKRVEDNHARANTTPGAGA